MTSQNIQGLFTTPKSYSPFLLNHTFSFTAIKLVTLPEIHLAPHTFTCATPQSGMWHPLCLLAHCFPWEPILNAYSESPPPTNRVWKQPAATLYLESQGLQNNSPSLDSDHPSQPHSGQMACSPETVAGMPCPPWRQDAQAECSRTFLSYRCPGRLVVS